MRTVVIVSGIAGEIKVKDLETNLHNHGCVILSDNEANRQNVTQVDAGDPSICAKKHLEILSRS